MKGPAIVSMLWPKDFGVLESFVYNNPGTVVFASSQGPADPDQVRRVTAAGGELSLLEDLLSLYDRARLKAGSKRRLSRLEAVLGAEEWSRFAADHGWSGKQMGAIIARRARADLSWIATTIASLEHARSSNTLRLVVVNDDFTPGARTAVLWAREHGIPSLHLSHGLAMCQPHTVHGRVMSDVMAVFGERGAEDWLDADAGALAEKIRVTGNPAWDTYSQMIPQRAAIRAELAARHGCPPSRPWVVFTTTWAANLTAFCDEGAYGHTLRLFLQACKTLLDTGSPITIVIKDRWATQAIGSEPISSERAGELVAELGIDPERVVYTQTDIEKWIVSADVVVSAGSNASVEALLASTPAVNLVTETNAALDVSFDAESGVVEAEGHELAAALEKILSDEDHREHLRAEMRRAAPRYNLGFDGTATARVVALMEELALPAAPPRPRGAAALY